MNTDRNRQRRLVVLSGIVLFMLSRMALAAGQEPAVGIETFEALEKAIDRAREEVRDDPGDVEANYRLARLLMIDGKFQAAERSLNQALKIERDHLPCVMALAELNRKRFRYDEAEAALDAIRAVLKG